VAEETAPPKDAQQGPARSSSRALASGAFGLAKRFLTLREGSVVLITALTFLYFSVNTPEFFTNSNFKSLLPYFAPIAILGAGEVLLMINGEIDLLNTFSQTTPLATIPLKQGIVSPPPHTD